MEKRDTMAGDKTFSIKGERVDNARVKFKHEVASFLNLNAWLRQHLLIYPAKRMTRLCSRRDNLTLGTVLNFQMFFHIEIDWVITSLCNSQDFTFHTTIETSKLLRKNSLKKEKRKEKKNFTYSRAFNNWNM